VRRALLSYVAAPRLSPFIAEQYTVAVRHATDNFAGIVAEAIENAAIISHVRRAPPEVALLILQSNEVSFAKAADYGLLGVAEVEVSRRSLNRFNTTMYLFHSPIVEQVRGGRDQSELLGLARVYPNRALGV
jgi:hypothetical protein